ncbi:hypothetical protein AVEN_46315-1 [Araneus ventricosus]|uniref:Transposable element P transposase n=2 Tax=Araneus ventricosus TaxID=182803 RepID=A0A4Y2JZW9_ARAVE|nr:hypothetical protein AVEN_46315-1 [Araneus ventricosus]
MNSSKLHPPSNKPLQAGYGLEKYFSQQEQILQNMKEEMNGMRVQGKKSLLPFQKGILISISSLSGLWNDLKILKFSYILASRLTQDSLESLFSQIRGAGRFYDHPSSVEVIYRLRNLLLANKLPILSPKVNTREDSINEGYLTVDILKNAFAEKDIQEIHELPSEEDDLVAFENLCSEEFPMEWKIDEPSNYCGMTFSEHEGLKYIAGYIASRVRSEDSSLGYFSAEKTDSESAPWIYALSKGGLTVPTEAWLKITEEMECLFVSIHGKSGYHSGKNVTKQMIKILEEKYPDVNRKAIKIFSRLRTFIRIRYLNRNSPKDIRKSEKKMNKWLKSSS